MRIRQRLAYIISGTPVPLDEQAALLPFEPEQTKPTPENIEGRKLNLGSGHDNKVGWINIDIHERHQPDIVSDVTKLTEIDDNSAAYALAQDVLEHISRDTVMTALREWNRALFPGGLLEIRTTDVIAITDLMRKQDTPEDHNRFLQCMFGTQGYIGDFHLSGFTETWMRDALVKTGFEVVYLGRKDKWLLDVVARKISHCPPDPLITEGTNEEFLRTAYTQLLGRDLDEEGRVYWMQQLSDGITREFIVRHLNEIKV